MELWGNLKDFSLPDVIQLVGFGRKTGVLSVKHGSAGTMLYFQEGNVIHAESGDLTGEAAVYQLFMIDDGEFRFRADVAAPKQTIFMDPTNLVMEAARLADESSRTETPAALPDEMDLGDFEVVEPEPAVESDNVVDFFSDPAQEIEQRSTAPSTGDFGLPGDLPLGDFVVVDAPESEPPAESEDLSGVLLELEAEVVQPPEAEPEETTPAATPDEVRNQIKALLETKFGKDSKRLMQAVDKCGDSVEDFQELITRVERFVSAFVDPSSAKEVGEELRQLTDLLPPG